MTELEPCKVDSLAMNHPVGIPPFHNFSQNILHHLMHYSDEMRKELIQELINIWNGVEGC